MKYWRYIIAAVPLFLFASCAKEVTEDRETATFSAPATNLKLEECPGVLNLKVKDGLENPDELVGMLSDVLSVRSVRPRFPDNPKFREARHKAGLDRWYTVFYEEDSLSTKAGLSVAGLPFVEEVGTIGSKTIASFNDPAYGRQWHYWNTGQLSGFVKGSDIRLEDAWKFSTGSEDVIVAVLDEGIRYTHEDLRDNMWVNEAELNGQEGVDDDGNGYVDDIHGYNFCWVEGYEMYGKIVPEDHGTHVAGTIAAVNNNGLGGCGIAGGDGVHRGVRIMCCQMIQEKTATENYPSDADLAYVYAVENGASICNNSWSGYVSKDVLRYFNEFAGRKDGEQTGPMAGGVCFFAAGNDSRQYEVPAMYDEVYSVAAIGPNMKKATYSNYGDWVDISAPGGDMNASYSYSWGVYSCTAASDRSYDLYQGTSMACPHVTGIAALAISAFGGEGFTREDLIELLDNSANRAIYDNSASYEGKLGKGLVDAGKVFSCMYPGAVTDFSLSAKRNMLTVKWMVPRAPFKGVISCFRIKCNDTEVEVPATDAVEGEVMIQTIQDLEYDSEYAVSITAIGDSGRESLPSSVKKIRTEANLPPVITVLKDIEISLNRNQSGSLPFSFKDPEGDKTVVSIEPQAAGLSLETLYEGTVAVRIDAAEVFRNAGAGTFSASLVVSDGVNATRCGFSYTIIDYITPEIIKAIPDFTLKGCGQTVSLKIDEYFSCNSNPDVSVTGTKPIFSSSVSGNEIRITAAKLGETQVTVTILDKYGDDRSLTFTLTVIDSGRKVDIYPTVFSDSFTVRVNSEQTQKIQLMLISQSGTILVNRNCSSGIDSPVVVTPPKSCSPGTYTVKLIFEDGTTFSQTVVKI